MNVLKVIEKYPDTLKTEYYYDSKYVYAIASSIWSKKSTDWRKYDSTYYIYDNGKAIKSEWYYYSENRGYSKDGFTEYLYNKDNLLESEEVWMLNGEKKFWISKKEFTYHDNQSTIAMRYDHTDYGDIAMDTFRIGNTGDIEYISLGVLNGFPVSYKREREQFIEYDNSKNYLSLLPCEPGYHLGFNNKHNKRLEREGETKTEYSHILNSEGLPIKSYIIDSTGKHLYREYFYFAP